MMWFMPIISVCPKCGFSQERAKVELFDTEKECAQHLLAWCPKCKSKMDAYCAEVTPIEKSEKEKL